MKKLINFLAIAFVAVALVGCGKTDTPTPPEPDPETVTLYKSWKLVNWPDPQTTFTKNVYVEFSSAGSFVLYQDIETVGYVKYEGSFVYNESTKALTGQYSDGKAWKETYTVSDLTVGNLTLLGSSDATSVYSHVQMPTDILNQVALMSSAYTGEVEPFL